MIFDYETLKFIWWVLIGVLLMGFAITDGMDMGVGMLLPFIGKTDDERRVMINAVGPHWDGNQVWLITAGGAIFAAWPTVYATAFSGFYMAMLLLLYSLFFRPVGFDYRSKIDSSGWRSTWDWGIFAGSAIPSLIFGVAFGNLIQGVPFHLDSLMRSHYQGELLGALLPLLNPFAILAGILSVSMLAMHGAVWLQLRTDDAVARRAKRTVLILGAVALAVFAIAGLWVAYGIEGYRIVSQPALNGTPNPLGKTVTRAVGAWLDIYGTAPVAILAPVAGFAGIALAMILSLRDRAGLAFIASGTGIAGIIATAGLSMFPFVMPSNIDPNSSLTLWDSSSSHLTLMVMFWAVVIFLPIVLSYNVWCYVRMWGKVTVADIRARSHAAY